MGHLTFESFAQPAVDFEVDFVVVGSGAGGAAAATMPSQNRRVESRRRAAILSSTPRSASPGRSPTRG